ncbi:MAG: DNA adenine methylase [Bacillota bacterium]
MQKNKLLQPFLKWAGGKRQLLPEIRKYIPKRIKKYHEPFVGAGAVLFDLQPSEAVINDFSVELINCYIVIKDFVDDLIQCLSKHNKFKMDKQYYYHIRDLDRQETFNNLSPVEKAARIIFLNKTCYNGLFRVNSEGHFNVPFGNYNNPKVLDEILLKAIHNYLSMNDIKILNNDFEIVVENVKKGDFVYMDPPYDPVSDTSSFTGYNLFGFGKEDQIRLKCIFDKLSDIGAKVLLSNSNTDFILSMYKEYRIEKVTATRNINSVASGRGKIDEVLVMNYDPKV